jgi:hypothetical protein
VILDFWRAFDEFGLSNGFVTRHREDHPQQVFDSGIGINFTSSLITRHYLHKGMF